MISRGFVAARRIWAVSIFFVFGSAAGERGNSFAELQQFVDGVVDTGVPGLVLRVAHDGTEWVGAAGVADVEQQVEMRSGTTFPVFSVTKTFTAAVTLQLIDEGKLSFEDTLGNLLSATSHAERVRAIPYGEEATVRQLLNYSSGFFDYGNAMDFLHATVGTEADFSRQWTIDDLLAYAQDERNEPAGPPGSAFSYSSTGYLLLGLVIEEIEQQPLEAVLSERIFRPLDMQRSYLTSYENWRAPDITGYVMTNPEMLEMGLAGGFPVADGKLVNTTSGQRSRISAGRGENGIVTTAESLMSFARALFDGELVAPELLAEMVSPQDKVAAASPDTVHNYGMGIHLFDHGEQQWAMMMGNGAGGEVTVGRELNSGFTFVVLTNVFGAGVSDRTTEKMRAVVRDLASK